MAFRRTWLSPPTKPVFIFSVVVALLAVLAWLGVVRVPVVQAHLFELMLVAYIALFLGNVARRF